MNIHFIAGAPSSHGQHLDISKVMVNGFAALYVVYAWTRLDYHDL